MKNSVFVCLLICILSGCIKKSEYPLEIQKDHLEKYYDEAKWLFYLMYFDAECDMVKCYEGRNVHHPIACEDLKLFWVRKDTSTVDLAFRCYIDSCSECLSSNSDIDISKELVSRFIFEENNYDSVFIGGGGPLVNSLNFWLQVTKTEINSTARKAKMKSFLETHSCINQWFLKEAKRRGVLK